MLSDGSPIPVRFDIQPGSFNNTMQLLAELIARGEVTVVFGDEDETSLHLNPDRVTWFIDPTTNVRTPVVTLENLVTFGTEITVPGCNYAERARRVFNAARNDRKNYAAPYLFQEGELVRGFLALRLPQFAEGLQKQRIPITNLGPGSGNFLAWYCDSLFLHPAGPAEERSEPLV